VSPALANFLFETANFLLLAAALGWLLFKPVRGALDAERAGHEKAVAAAAQLRAEAESLAKESRAARDGAERDAAQVRAAILSTAKKEAEAILEAARQESAEERRTLLRELEAARQAEVEALADSAGQIAAESVRRLLLSLEAPALDLSLVRAACRALRTLPEPARRGALVESARPLGATERGLLQGTLGDSFKERTITELGAGLRVTTLAGQVDASAVAFAREAARAMHAVLTTEDADRRDEHA